MYVVIQPVSSLSASGHKTGIVMYSGDGGKSCNFQQSWRLVHPFCFVGQLVLFIEEGPSHTLSSFPITRRTRLCIEKLLKILTVLLRHRKTSELCCNGGPRGSDTQDKSERLIAASGHHTEDMMATCHQPNVADRVHDGRR